MDDRLVRAWNGIAYKTGMWAENVGSNALSMNVAMIPPGGVAGYPPDTRPLPRLAL